MQNHPLERDLEAVGLSHCDVSTVFCQFILRSWISYHMSNLPSFHILKLFTNAYLCQGNQLSCQHEAEPCGAHAHVDAIL